MPADYYRYCRYCGMRVRGAQGIRSHLKACPFTTKGRNYIFNDVEVYLISTPSVMRFFDRLFQKFNLNEGKEFYWYLERFSRFVSSVRLDFGIIDRTLFDPEILLLS